MESLSRMAKEVSKRYIVFVNSPVLKHKERSFGGAMKKYILFGLLAGVTISALAIYFRRKQLAGNEFHEFFDSSAVADDLFGDAFEELPDKS